MNQEKKPNYKFPRPSYKDQRPSYQIPKRNWIRRNPRTFQILYIGTLLTVFFSKPLYDCFLNDNVPPARSAVERPQ